MSKCTDIQSGRLLPKTLYISLYTYGYLQVSTCRSNTLFSEAAHYSTAYMYYNRCNHVPMEWIQIINSILVTEEKVVTQLLVYAF